MNKPTCEQLIEQLGDKQDITICSDIVYGLGFEYQQLKNEVDRLTKNIHTAIEDIFTLLRVIDSNVKELKCTDEELKVINKYSYNPKEANND